LVIKCLSIISTLKFLVVSNSLLTTFSAHAQQITITYKNKMGLKKLKGKVKLWV